MALDFSWEKSALKYAELYQELALVRIDVPPLRERRDDVPVLELDLDRPGQVAGRQAPTLDPELAAPWMFAPDEPNPPWPALGESDDDGFR